MVTLKTKDQQSRAFSIHQNLEIVTNRKGCHFTKVVRWGPKSGFLGYITVVISLKGALAGFELFQKFELKILKNGFRADFPGKPAPKGARAGEYFSDGQYATAEVRAVIERKLFELPEVQAAIKELEALPKPANFGMDAETETEQVEDDSSPLPAPAQQVVNPYA